MKKCIILVFSILILSSFVAYLKHKPSVYLIGDSTVADGSGNNGLWGWGKFFPQFFDTTKVDIFNYALGGTSTRTFQTNGIWNPALNTKGMWDTVYTKLRKGDYLIIQFGLNDQSPVDDTSRSRGTLHGIGEDSVEIFNNITHKQEVVHSFGWYIRNFIKDAKEKGVTVIVCSTIPKNLWKEGKLIRGEYGFGDWALQVAQQEKVDAIDLNSLIADIYDKEGELNVTAKYHSATDNTHTTKAGAILNASLVAKAIGELKECKLKKYIIHK